jgi:5-methylcytosine-specific restriction endonuclease McrA
LTYTSKAELINEVADRALRSVDQTFPFPSVIKLNRYINVAHKNVVLTRHNVFKRDQFICQYCGDSGNLTLDHLIPKSKGGKTNWTNLVTACKPCNAKKGDYLIHEVDMLLNKNPVRPSFVMFLKNSANQSNMYCLTYLEPHAYA